MAEKKKKAGKKIKLQHYKSAIGYNKKQKQTIEAMGLGRPNNFSIMPDNPQTRGMIEVVKHLVKVEEISE